MPFGHFHPPGENPGELEEGLFGAKSSLDLEIDIFCQTLIPYGQRGTEGNFGQGVKTLRIGQGNLGPPKSPVEKLGEFQMPKESGWSEFGQTAAKPSDRKGGVLSGRRRGREPSSGIFP